MICNKGDKMNKKPKTITVTVKDIYSLYQLKYDCETIKSLIPAINNRVAIFGIIPYISLAVNNFLEMLDPQIRDNIANINQIEDVRLKLKVFDDRYSKSKRMILNIDYLQNENFKNLLKFEFLKEMKIYYNLGIFTNKDKVIVGNTQYDYYLLQDNGMLKKNLSDVVSYYEASPDNFNLNDVAGQKSFEYVRTCREIIMFACEALSAYDGPTKIRSGNSIIDIYHSDLNTNTSSIFLSKDCDKGSVLYILHILTSLNYLLYVLNDLEEVDYGWWLKTNYIAYYYSIRRLKSLHEYYIQNKPMPKDLYDLFGDLGLNKAPFINGSSEFRNCAMHSSFTNENQKFMISSLYLDNTKPLFGLVETCFDGKSYEEVKKEVKDEMKRISDILSQWLDIQSLNIRH